jgi:hypothetical protein
MDNLSREEPKRQPQEMAEQVIRQIDKDAMQDDLRDRINFIRAAHADEGRGDFES